MNEKFPHVTSATPDLARNFRTERERIAREIDEQRLAHSSKIARWATQFPEIAGPLRRHAERVGHDLEAMKSRDYQHVPDEDRARKEKADCWELLTILAQAVPDLPIAEMHDEASASIDAAMREGSQKKAALKKAANDTRVTMGDTAIDHHVSRRDGGATA
ncbi:hypothetical protein NLX83_01840 [Allokutzneria sp. A3M-2-11 16]|uniref:hypothetical protein n=1 Tax=Allokutzneria sp. A3M-2-11 16 TaxID=2962043 RepID=UPI0020B63E51|nr:hypothetical protein [Allokutzneria sp. A3M-2-11 16]MCP3797991.1 hypothetical protein [Allokutzneria sp. A3M-2-11 16]